MRYSQARFGSSEINSQARFGGRKPPISQNSRSHLLTTPIWRQATGGEEGLGAYLSFPHYVVTVPSFDEPCRGGERDGDNSRTAKVGTAPPQSPSRVFIACSQGVAAFFEFPTISPNSSPALAKNSSFRRFRGHGELEREEGDLLSWAFEVERSGSPRPVRRKSSATRKKWQERRRNPRNRREFEKNGTFVN